MNRTNGFKNNLLFYLICLSPWAIGLGDGLMGMTTDGTATVHGKRYRYKYRKLNGAQTCGVLHDTGPVTVTQLTKP